MQIPRIDPKNILGLLDKVGGLGKEIAGTVLNRDRLAKAGQVQQQKGSERIEAVKAQLSAQEHKTKAASAEGQQQVAQRTKEKVG